VELPLRIRPRKRSKLKRQSSVLMAKQSSKSW
jgi:hypothetical protein